ncbi:MAG: GNAT family N-acetyltransferase [Eubacteriales bacterium]|nr:GNAT family N-acetyltransferase [Eubacteriales bacterium]
MELSTNDLILRPVTENDIEEIARMWKHPEKISLEDASEVLKKMEQRHSKNRIQSIYHLCLGVFRKEEPHTLIGWCGWDGRGSSDEIVLFYIIAEEFRCRGYATQCAAELLRFAFEDMQYDRVSGGCAKENRSSFRVMEKAGMRHHEIYEDGGLGFYMDKEMFLKSKSPLG